MFTYIPINPVLKTMRKIYGTEFVVSMWEIKIAN